MCLYHSIFPWQQRIKMRTRWNANYSFLQWYKPRYRRSLSKFAMWLHKKATFNFGFKKIIFEDQFGTSLFIFKWYCKRYEGRLHKVCILYLFTTTSYWIIQLKSFQHYKANFSDSYTSITDVDVGSWRLKYRPIRTWLMNWWMTVILLNELKESTWCHRQIRHANLRLWWFIWALLRTSLHWLLKDQNLPTWWLWTAWDFSKLIIQSRNTLGTFDLRHGSLDVRHKCWIHSWWVPARTKHCVIFSPDVVGYYMPTHSTVWDTNIEDLLQWSWECLCWQTSCSWNKTCYCCTDISCGAGHL